MVYSRFHQTGKNGLARKYLTQMDKETLLKITFALGKMLRSEKRNTIFRLIHISICCVLMEIKLNKSEQMYGRVIWYVQVAADFSKTLDV